MVDAADALQVADIERVLRNSPGMFGAQRADFDADFHGRGTRQHRRRAANADRAADAPARPAQGRGGRSRRCRDIRYCKTPHRNLRQDFRRAAAGLSRPTVRTSPVVTDGTLIWHSFVGTGGGTILMVAPRRKWH